MRIQRKEKSLKKISEIKVNRERVLVFQDEVHFQIQTTITSGWYKKGSNPKVKSFPGRFKTSYSGFVIPETGKLFTTKPTTFNYETTISSIREFLASNPIQEGKKYVIVMDNAPWHKKAIRLIADEKREEYSDVNEKVEFLLLPPYSPDFNPIEQVWRITRREYTHNKFFPDLKTLESTVDSAFEVWAEPNTQLASLCSF